MPYREYLLNLFNVWCRKRYLVVFYSILLIIGPCPNTSRAGSQNDTLRVKKYVEKSSILLLNTKPNSDDIQALCAAFSLYDSFSSNRKLLIDSFIRSPQFAKSLFDQFRSEYLQGVDFDQLYEEMTDLKNVQAIKTLSAHFFYFRENYLKLSTLVQVEDNLRNRKITISDAQKCFFDNKFYDEANMGPVNYVSSSFNYLLLRLPTKYELESGRKMVTNNHSSLFMMEGNNKEDYLNILFSSGAYTEGQVRYWYSKLLGREPSLAEETPYLQQKNKFNIESLIRDIMLSNDFMLQQNQGDIKSKRKSSMSFVGIGYEDIYEAPSDLNSIRQLVRSYAACGDKNIIESILIRSILNKNSGVISDSPTVQSEQIDSVFAIMIKDCPVYGLNRSKDPLLLCLSVLYYITADPKSNVIDGYNQYQDWQKNNAPHSPWGLNETPAYFNGTDRSNWEIEYTKQWVKTYSKEYSAFLHFYDSIYPLAAPPAVSGENRNKTFLLNYVNIVQVRAPLVMSLLQEDHLNQEPSLPMTSALIKLRNDPSSFVEQLYENMFMRKPSQIEKEGLLTIIKDNPEITPEIIYYSLMTSPEYKYY